MICIYHHNCADGFGAAWVVRKALGGNVSFLPGIYNNAPPNVEDEDVYIVDFSYKRPVMEAMAEKCRSMLVLDHHKTAAEDLEGFAKPRRSIDVVFDMERSGAMIAWNHFFPDTDPPDLIRVIQDRDLWKFELKGTREIQAALFSYPYDFELWDRLMSMDVRALAADGVAIERKHHKDVAELVQAFQRSMEIGGFEVPVANIPYTLTSDAGQLMATPGDVPFAACYWDTPDGRVFSLRSTPQGADVSAIAKRYGGGGHKHAAGFRVAFDKLQEEGLL